MISSSVLKTSAVPVAPNLPHTLPQKCRILQFFVLFFGFCTFTYTEVIYSGLPLRYPE